MKNCPNCSAPLQENALFCPHCMTQLGEKQILEAPKVIKSKRKKVLSILLALIVVLSAFSCGTGLYYHKKHAPICTYEQFREAVPVISEKMKIDNLWEMDNFIDTHYFEEQKITQYSTDINIKNALLSVFFYNKGEQVLAYISDVNPNDFSKAETLLKCITQSVCNYYFTDIDKVFDDEKLYPKKTIEVPFDSFYTDLISRTEQYNSDIKNGTSITTKCITMSDDTNITIAYFVTERNTNGSILYDLSLNIFRD